MAGHASRIAGSTGITVIWRRARRGKRDPDPRPTMNPLAEQIARRIRRKDR